MREPLTGSQTVGPFFHYGLAWKPGEHLFPDPNTPGERITLTGTVRDGKSELVFDAFLELWQPDGAGQFGHPNQGSCAGWGRVNTNAQGVYVAQTVMPGSVQDAAPHVMVVLFARGLLKQVVTRIYFAGDARNAAEPALQSAGARAQTLIAQPDPARPGVWVWDVVLQGDHETVFFDL